MGASPNPKAPLFPTIEITEHLSYRDFKTDAPRRGVEGPSGSALELLGAGMTPKPAQG